MIKDMCPQLFPLAAVDEGGAEWRVVGWAPVSDPDEPLLPIGVRLDVRGAGARVLSGGGLTFHERGARPSS